MIFAAAYAEIINLLITGVENLVTLCSSSLYTIQQRGEWKLSGKYWATAAASMHLYLLQQSSEKYYFPQISIFRRRPGKGIGITLHFCVFDEFIVFITRDFFFIHNIQIMVCPKSQNQSHQTFSVDLKDTVERVKLFKINFFFIQCHKDIH